MNDLPVIWPEAGSYVLAVSGGADSMALLAVMVQAAASRHYDLFVAHVDHGLRPDSAADRQHVQQAAAHYGLPFSYYAARLPAGSSEAAARQARHSWLAAEAARWQAVVVTAHHQDDLIETSLLNLARGSGRRGLAPMHDQRICRPFLDCSREQLRRYAAHHGLTWREDPTNADLSNPRNLLRHQLLATALDSWRSDYVQALKQVAKLNQQIDNRLSDLIDPFHHEGAIEWPAKIMHNLSLSELAEVLAAGIRKLSPGTEVSARLLAELALFAKTARPPRRRPVCQRVWLQWQGPTLVLSVC